MAYSFSVTLTTAPKQKPDPDKLVFGKYFTDHMFVMDYSDDKGWHDGRIVPYGPIAIDPAAAALHYGQEIFEGLKAYKAPDGRILLFRPDMNAKRTISTCDRLCIPPIDEELFIEAIKAVVRVDAEWIPDRPGTSLYIRPFIFADEPFLGVHPAHHFKFVIILSPVGAYYGAGNSGLVPQRIFVEEEYVRAAPGGTGAAKVAGNYAGSLKAQEKAMKAGCAQVLWLDAVERRYVEEIGTSNAFFVIGDEIITAPLLGTILPGVTRDSVIKLLKKWGMNIQERRLSIDEVVRAAEDGTLREAFATGTAAVISPVGELLYRNRTIVINNNQTGPLSQKLYDTLYGIQTGKVEDDMGWTVAI